MANNYRLVGSDSITLTLPILDGAVTLSDFAAHGEVGKISFSSDLVTVKTGKSGNAIFASNETGNQATLELRMLRGSPDDIKLQHTLDVYKSDPAAFVLITSVITKRLGTGLASSVPGTGKIIADQFALVGGVITKNVEMLSNVEGDVDQALAIWTLQFASAARTIG